MSKPASEAALGELHAVVATWLTGKIKDGEASAADISNAIKMLKDNSITCVVEKGSALDELKEQLEEKGKAMTPDQQDLAAALDSLDFQNARAN